MLGTNSIPRPTGEVTSGTEADGLIPLARFRCSSSCLIPGNGNNFESVYFNKSADDAGGTGETPPGGAVCGDSDKIEVEAEGVCISGG